jgi:hypothetical protein
MDSDFTLALLMFALKYREDLKLILMVRRVLICCFLCSRCFNKSFD